VVAGLHLLAGWLFLAANKIRILIPRQERDVSLTFLSFTQAGLPAAATKTIVRKPMVPPPAIIAPAPNNAIAVPWIDWGAEAEVGVHQQMDNEEQAGRWRNLAGPSDSQLDWAKSNAPPVSERHKLGDSERAEGGGVITWENDRCYWTTRGITSFGMPQTSKVCKDPPKPEVELFKDMQKKLDERDARRTP
jgi:hypothetical protein